MKQKPGDNAENPSAAAKTGKKPGLPPGSLVYTGEKVQFPVSMQLIQFDEHSIQRYDESNMEILAAALDPRKVNWINVNGLHDAVIIERLGTHFGISPLVLEDILHTEHMPKLEDHDGYLFFTLKMLSFNDGENRIEQEHVSMILGDYYLITFQEKEGDVFDLVRENLKNRNSRLRKHGSDYLLYRLLDIIVDHYYIVTGKIEENLEIIEETLLQDAPDGVSGKILAERKNMIFLRRSIFPLREEMRKLKQRDSQLITDGTYVFLEDVSDHLTHLSQNLESSRELINSLMELQMAVNANRMNDVMKTLTIFAAVFMPLTFLAGIYGMNFHLMPELEWSWGYPLVLGVMALVAGFMLFYMKRRKWF